MWGGSKGCLECISHTQCHYTVRWHCSDIQASKRVIHLGTCRAARWECNFSANRLLLSSYPVTLSVLLTSALPALFYLTLVLSTISIRLTTDTVETRGSSASIRILYTYITSSGDIHCDNRSYAVVVQWKSCARRQISAPSVPSYVHANGLSFKMCVFWVVKGPHSCRERCHCSHWYVRML